MTSCPKLLTASHEKTRQRQLWKRTVLSLALTQSQALPQNTPISWSTKVTRYAGLRTLTRTSMAGLKGGYEDDVD
jgi:hypothetical protein